jgi:opacity protein-like surface antigen
MKSILTAAAIVVATATVASAQTSTTPRIDARQSAQQARINQGVASGQLTNREAANLQRGQARVQRMENRAAADGVVTRGEQARINRAQNVESRKIYNKKHNLRTR